MCAARPAEITGPMPVIDFAQRATTTVLGILVQRRTDRALEAFRQQSDPLEEGHRLTLGRGGADLIRRLDAELLDLVIRVDHIPGLARRQFAGALFQIGRELANATSMVSSGSSSGVGEASGRRGLIRAWRSLGLVRSGNMVRSCWMARSLGMVRSYRMARSLGLGAPRLLAHSCPMGLSDSLARSRILGLSHSMARSADLGALAFTGSLTGSGTLLMPGSLC